jgi:hypothetical protein
MRFTLLILSFIALSSSAIAESEDQYVGFWTNEKGVVVEIKEEGPGFLLRIGSDIENRVTIAGKMENSCIEAELPMVGASELAIHNKTGVLSVSGLGAFQKMDAESVAAWVRVTQKRIAQNIACRAAEVRAAGYTKSWSNIESAIADLKKGITICTGENRLTVSIPEMSSDEQKGATNYLVYDPQSTSTLLFNSDPRYPIPHR